MTTAQLKILDAIFTEAEPRGRLIAIELVIEYSRSMLGGPKKPRRRELTEAVRIVLEDVASRHPGVTFDDIRGRSTFQEVCAARREAMARVRAMGFSLPGVGRFFDRDHSSVHAALRKFEADKPLTALRISIGSAVGRAA